VATKIQETAGLIVAEMKTRGMDHTKINVDPEQKCEFLGACKKKLEAINNDSKAKVLLPCYYCEFNTTKYPLPNPRSRYIVIDRDDITRHYNQLKIPMKLGKWEAVLMAMNVLEKGRYFVLNFAEPLAQDTALDHLGKLAARRRAKQAVQIHDDAQAKGTHDGNAAAPAPDAPGTPDGASIPGETGSPTQSGVAGSQAPESGTPPDQLPGTEVRGAPAAETTAKVGSQGSPSV